MKKLIGLMAFAFMIFAVPVVHAADMDDVTMTVMDINDDHASDITNDIEVPEQADDHAGAESDKGDDHSAKNEQEHEHEMEQEQEHEQEMEIEDEHRDEAHDDSHDETEVEQHDSEDQPESDN
jgi:hypothetical protein